MPVESQTEIFPVNHKEKLKLLKKEIFKQNHLKPFPKGIWFDLSLIFFPSSKTTS